MLNSTLRPRQPGANRRNVVQHLVFYREKLLARVAAALPVVPLHGLRP